MFRYIFIYGYGSSRVAAYADLELEIREAQRRYVGSLCPASGAVCTDDGMEYMAVQQFSYLEPEEIDSTTRND